MTARTLAVVSAGLSTPSSTRLLADRLAAATSEALAARDASVRVEHVELRNLARPLADRLVTGFPSDELAAALDTVARADGLIAVTPVFSGSYSGLFKTFFDVLDPEALEDLPTLVAATGGSVRHSLVTEHALRPLLTYLRAVVVPTAVYAATEDFGRPEATEPDGRLAADVSLGRRIDKAAGQLAALVAGPRRRLLPDPLDAPVDFSTLLGR
jgi:FMN reductase